MRAFPSKQRTAGSSAPVFLDSWTVKIIYTDSYTDHGCNFTGNLALVRYWESANHGFNTANSSRGVHGTSDRARAMVLAMYPDAQLLLAVPDLVMRLPDPTHAAG